MKIKKVSQSAGIIAEIEQKLDSNSEVNAPSVKAVKNAIKELDDKNNYSTEEQVIGKYLGKPFYRKVITSAFNDGDTILENVDLIKIEGTAYLGGLKRALPYYEFYSDHHYKAVVEQTDNHEVIARVLYGGEPSYATFNAIMEYTKITD